VDDFRRNLSGAILGAGAGNAAILPQARPCDIACGHALDAPGFGSAMPPAGFLMTFDVVGPCGKKRAPRLASSISGYP